jgi:hypothetical protein
MGRERPRTAAEKQCCSGWCAALRDGQFEVVVVGFVLSSEVQIGEVLELDGRVNA